MFVLPPDRGHSVWRFVLVLTTLSLAVTACGTSDDQGADDDPDIRPEVLAHEPPGGQEEVPLDAVIAVTFSERMSPGPTESHIAYEPNVSCDYTWNPYDTRVVCDPVATLTPGTEYTVTVGGDAIAHNRWILGEDHAFSFTTEAAGP